MAITPEKKKQTTTTTTTPKPESRSRKASPDTSASETSPSPEGEPHLSGLAKEARESASSEPPTERSSETPTTSQEMRVPGNLSDPQEGPLEDRPVSPLDPVESSENFPASFTSTQKASSSSPSGTDGSSRSAPEGSSFIPRSVVASSDPAALAEFLTVTQESSDPLEADRAMQELMAAARANPQLVNAAVTRAEELDRKAENQAIMERRRVAEHNMLNQGIDAHYASELDRRRATEGF